MIRYLNCLTNEADFELQRKLYVDKFGTDEGFVPEKSSKNCFKWSSCSFFQYFVAIFFK